VTQREEEEEEEEEEGLDSYYSSRSKFHRYSLLKFHWSRVCMCEEERLYLHLETRVRTLLFVCGCVFFGKREAKFCPSFCLSSLGGAESIVVCVQIREVQKSFTPPSDRAAQRRAGGEISRSGIEVRRDTRCF
jgi:hypothetical protein